MRETLSQSICDLININWISWLFLLLGSVVGAMATNFLRTTEMSASGKVLGFASSCW